MSNKIKAINFGETRTYSVGNGFYVDIVKERQRRAKRRPCYSVWLYHIEYGVKDFIFGIPVEVTSWKLVLEKVKNEIYANEHVHNYYMAYM